MRGELRMAHATLRADSPAEILAAIHRLYQELQALPTTERPRANCQHAGAGQVYLDLQDRIRRLADRYRALTDTTTNDDQTPDSPVVDAGVNDVCR